MLFHSGKSKLWPFSNPGQPQHPGRDQDMALKSQQWLLEQRTRSFCAAFLKLLPLCSPPWPWSKLPGINGNPTLVLVGFSSGPAFRFQTSQSQVLKPAWLNAAALHRAAGAVPEAHKVTFSFHSHCSLLMKYSFLPLTRCAPQSPQSHFKKNARMVLKSQSSCLELDFHQRPWVHLGHLCLVWVVGGG